METTMRAKAYEAAGANGIFVPFVTDIYDIEKIVNATSLPVNVFFCKGLPGFKTLSRAGVKRISMGTALYRKMKKDLLHHIQQVQHDQSADSLC